MKLEQEVIGNVTVVRADGRLDASTTASVYKMITAILNDGKTNLVLDMKAVKSISSYCLGVLVTLNKQLKTKGSALKLAGLTPEVRVPFEITGVLAQFEVFNDVDSAVKN
ncbi:MAG: STAS domain-containing protein [Nitrospinae bacterium]|nr:STAS domain-containing protein [Nitrospinota bacterium]